MIGCFLNKTSDSPPFYSSSVYSIVPRRRRRHTANISSLSFLPSIQWTDGWMENVPRMIRFDYCFGLARRRRRCQSVFEWKREQKELLLLLLFSPPVKSLVHPFGSVVVGLDTLCILVIIQNVSFEIGWRRRVQSRERSSFKTWSNLANIEITQARSSNNNKKRSFWKRRGWNWKCSWRTEKGEA